MNSSNDIEARLRAESESYPDVEFCAECREECQGNWVDFGIGSYEFWGQKCHDSRWGYASTCCEAEVIKNGRLYEGPEPDEGDQADYLHEQEKDRQLMEQLYDEEASK